MNECKTIEAGQTWPEFVEANADLFDWKDNILKSYYQDETLKSERARRTFVFPTNFPGLVRLEHPPRFVG